MSVVNNESHCCDSFTIRAPVCKQFVHKIVSVVKSIIMS